MTMLAGKLLVETLKAGGADRAFCVPGESFLGALDAFADDNSIKMVSCRHEGGAGFMALADAKLTDRPGLLFVSRGPGASNGTIAIHSAEQDAVPLLAFVGQVPRNERGRRAFQEVDYVKTYSDIAKWVVEIDDPARVSELVARAWRKALSGRPGPVVVSLPEDMLLAEVEVPVIAPGTPVQPAPANAELLAAAAMIAKSERPLLIAGGQIGAAGQGLLRQAAEAWQLPVVGAHKQQGVFANDHANWAGHLGYVVPPSQRAAFLETDLIVALGTPLGDVETQNYTLPRAPVAEQAVIHVYPDPGEVGRMFLPTLGIVADAQAWLLALLEQPKPDTSAARKAWLHRLHALNNGLRNVAPAAAGKVSFDDVVREISRQADADAIFTIDSGSFASAVHRQTQVTSERALLGWASGAMGGGVPSAVAASLRFPSRQVICFVGDGGVLMTGNELATAQQYGAGIKIVVCNNNEYGAIRAHQTKLFPGREVATSLANPDFVAWARAFHAEGHLIEPGTDIASTIGMVLAAPGSALIEVRVK